MSSEFCYSLTVIVHHEEIDDLDDLHDMLETAVEVLKESIPDKNQKIQGNRLGGALVLHPHGQKMWADAQLLRMKVAKTHSHVNGVVARILNCINNEVRLAQLCQEVRFSDCSDEDIAVVLRSLGQFFDALYGPECEAMVPRFLPKASIIADKLNQWLLWIFSGLEELLVPMLTNASDIGEWSKLFKDPKRQRLWNRIIRCFDANEKMERVFEPNLYQVLKQYESMVATMGDINTFMGGSKSLEACKDLQRDIQENLEPVPVMADLDFPVKDWMTQGIADFKQSAVLQGYPDSDQHAAWLSNVPFGRSTRLLGPVEL